LLKLQLVWLHWWPNLTLKNRKMDFVSGLSRPKKTGTNYAFKIMGYSHPFLQNRPFSNRIKFAY